MPELPEVETIVRALREGGRGSLPIIGKTIASAMLLWNKTLAYPELPELQRRIIGQNIVDLTRRGKYICLQLDDDWLFIHLRMSGDLRVDEPPLDKFLPHDRFALNFTDNSRLVFNDVRKFGRVWFDKSPEIIFNRVGVEPFDPALTPELFHNKVVTRNRIIKTLLLDQTFVCGLGNIYTDESLHLAGIHPLRKAGSLTQLESAKLLQSIREILHEGIAKNGTSIDWVYRGGDYQNHFRVYQKNGKPCQVCGNMIERIVVGQRGTHFCPVCQPERVGG